MTDEFFGFNDPHLDALYPGEAGAKLLQMLRESGWGSPEEMRERQVEIRRITVGTQAELATMRQERDDLLVQIQFAESRIDTLGRTMLEAANRIDLLGPKFNELEQTIKSLQIKLTTLEMEVQRKKTQTYTTPNAGGLYWTTNSANPNSVPAVTSVAGKIVLDSMPVSSLVSGDGPSLKGMVIAKELGAWDEFRIIDPETETYGSSKSRTHKKKNRRRRLLRGE